MSEQQEPMKYGMVGEDHQPTADKLSKYTGEVGWDYLKPHYETGVLVFVDQRLKLEDVGACFANDRKEEVEKLMKAGDLVKIEALHAAQWEGGSDQFLALVVSPFVLFQVLS